MAAKARLSSGTVRFYAEREFLAYNTGQGNNWSKTTNINPATAAA